MIENLVGMFVIAIFKNRNRASVPVLCAVCRLDNSTNKKMTTNSQDAYARSWPNVMPCGIGRAIRPSAAHFLVGY